MIGRETHPGWWLHKVTACGLLPSKVIVRVYYPTSIPKVPR